MKARKFFYFVLFFLFLMTFCYSSETVRLGIDNIDNYLTLFKGKRVGLITNQTGLNSDLESSIDVLKGKTNLTELYCPEHGIRGDAGPGDNIDTYKDPISGLIVHSLYKNGTGIEPTKEMLANVDILTYDIQDVGARFYTYISTMIYAMQSCKTYDKTFVVFDRPNPLSGEVVEGGPLLNGYHSFVSMATVPVRYGLTVGELAKYLNQKFGINCKLEVVPMLNWHRDMYWKDTKLIWIPPSPNIPTPLSALVYSGICFFEGTNISVGRGTTTPFTQIGAPWIKNPVELSEKLNSLHLLGVKFRPLYFTPNFDMYKDKLCGGIGIIVTDEKAYKSITVALNILYTIRSMYGNVFKYREPDKKGRWWIDLLSGSDIVRKSNSAESVLNRWKPYDEAFKKIAEKYYIYK